MAKTFITARDVEDLKAAGHSELVLDTSTVLTDAARDRAGEMGLRVTHAEHRESSGRDTVASPDAAGGDGPATQEVAQAVRSRLKDEGIPVPDNLNEVIDEVIADFGRHA